MKFALYSLLCLFLLQACSPNNVNTDNSLKQFFDEKKVDGCFALLDNGTGKFTIYNLPRYRDSSYLPASTFKIVNALIGLQTGKITDDSMVIKWDGVQRPIEEWNRDLTMYEAFRVWAVPYFQEVARRIGKDTMEYWLGRIGYSAATDTSRVAITSAIDTFWLDNSMKVSPDMQLELVRKLYFDQLPGFFKLNQEMVKNAMLWESNTKYSLSYKTGWGYRSDNPKINLAWVVGWIEENNHPYFFVLNFESKDPDADIRAIRMDILKGILKKLGFFEGKM